MEHLYRNEAQEDAIECTQGPVILISCPGSGKTTTLIRRIHTLLETGADPRTILMVTFTRAAAQSMRDRFQVMYGKNPGIIFQTIHSLCFNILRAEGKYDTSDIISAHKELQFLITRLREYRWVSDAWELARDMQREFSVIRGNDIRLSDYQPQSCKNPAFSEMFTAYGNWKDDNHFIDYDDMLQQCRDLLVDDRDVLRRWQRQFQYIQCDEYQDTNQTQRDILYLLAGEEKNLCVVGDDDQSIYRFRGARPEIMLAFPNDFPQAKVIRMGTNYRSGQSIVDRSARLIAFNKARFPKDFVSFRGENGVEGNVRCYRYNDRSAELDDIMNIIEAQHQRGIAYNDMAILMRTNRQASLPVGRLAALKLPYFSTEQVKSIYDGFIFGDIRAYASLAMGTGTNEQLLRVLNHPMRFLKVQAFRGASFDRPGLMRALDYLRGGPYWQYRQAVERIDDWLAVLGPGRISPGDSPQVLFEALTGRDGLGLGYEGYLKNYAEFRNLPQNDLTDELEELRKESGRFRSIEEWFDYADHYEQELDLQNRKKDRDGVVVTTMHKAKGLEWNTVFIIDCDEKILPHENSAGTKEGLEEERRLMYVAMTRAKDTLVICTASKTPSLFLPEIFPEAFHITQKSASSARKRRRKGKR